MFPANIGYRLIWHKLSTNHTENIMHFASSILSNDFQGEN